MTGSNAGLRAASEAEGRRAACEYPGHRMPGPRAEYLVVGRNLASLTCERHMGVAVRVGGFGATTKVTYSPTGRWIERTNGN